MNPFRMLLLAVSLIVAAPVGAVDGVNLPGRRLCEFPGSIRALVPA
jgi:hypothetical protein